MILSAAEIAAGLTELFFRKAEPHQRRARPAAVGKAAHAVEPLIQGLLPVDQLIEASLPQFQLTGCFIQLPLNLHHILKNGKHFIIDASRFVCAGMLLQVADARLLGEESLARRWLHLPRNQAKQRSFARTVHADQADPIMLAYLKGDIVEQLFFAEADA